LRQKSWENTASKWAYYTSPFRPSGGDIKNYEGILRRINRKEKVLILGATPELRDVVAKMDFDVTIADFSLPMVKGMLSFALYKEKYRERWVIADWLKLEKILKPAAFGIILGDLVLRNIEPLLQKKFLKIISDLLDSQGFFITRIHFVNENLSKKSSTVIITDILKRYPSRDNQTIEDLITSRLFDKNTDYKKHNINKNLFLNDTKNCLKNFSENNKALLVLRNILKKWEGGKTWTQRTRKEINTLITKYFVIKNLKFAADYEDSRFYPFYTLLVKKINQ
jgi:hypothetical protein